MYRPLNKDAQKIVLLQKSLQKRKEMIFQIIQKIKSSDQSYKDYKNFIKQFLKQKSQSISQMQTRKNTFFIDCMRQIMSFPNKKQKEVPIYNFVQFFKLPLDKEMRRVLWTKCLINEQSKKQFFKYNHQVIPYNIENDFRIIIENIAEKEEIKIKESQKDVAIKLLEYSVKKYNILPTRTQVYLCIAIVDLFSYYQVSKINQIGAIYYSLEELASYYFQPNLEIRFSNIFKALELIDEQSYSMIQQAFFQNQQLEGKSKVQLNQIYQNFRLSLSSKYLPLPSTQYFIDQVLIKKRNKFDMYVLFAIVILVLGDLIEKLIQNSALKKADSPNKIQLLNSSRSNADAQKNPLQNLMKNMMPPVQQKLNNRSRIIQAKNKKIQSPKKNILQEQSVQKLSFRSIFNDSKTVIKTSDIIQAFNVIYEKIPAIYPSTYQLQQNNKLFEFLLEYQSQQPVYIQKSKNQKSEYDYEMQELQAQLKALRRKGGNDPESFIVKIQDPNNPLRIGSRK